jgi:hypothetical protein
MSFLSRPSCSVSSPSRVSLAIFVIFIANNIESNHNVIFFALLILLLFPVETFPSTLLLKRALCRRRGADWWLRILRGDGRCCVSFSCQTPNKQRPERRDITWVALRRLRVKYLPLGSEVILPQIPIYLIFEKFSEKKCVPFIFHCLDWSSTISLTW